MDLDYPDWISRYSDVALAAWMNVVDSSVGENGAGRVLIGDLPPGVGPGPLLNLHRVYPTQG